MGSLFSENAKVELRGELPVYPNILGRGYATEAGRAILDYTFNQLQPAEVYGIADYNNHASRHVLEKLGPSFQQTFDFQGPPADWLVKTRPA